MLYWNCIDTHSLLASSTQLLTQLPARWEIYRHQNVIAAARTSTTEMSQFLSAHAIFRNGLPNATRHHTSLHFRLNKISPKSAVQYFLTDWQYVVSDCCCCCRCRHRRLNAQFSSDVCMRCGLNNGKLQRSLNFEGFSGNVWWWMFQFNIYQFVISVASSSRRRHGLLCALIAQCALQTPHDSHTIRIHTLTKYTWIFQTISCTAPYYD